jgi:putative transposase
VKKPLSQQMHVFGSGTIEPVQRDLYSAFLARCCETDHLDIRWANAAWPSAEPLLRRTMARETEPASGPDFARPGVLESAAPKGRVCSCEAVDVVAPAKAAESRNLNTLRAPGL